MDHPDKALQEVDLLFARRAVGDERAVELHGVHGNVQDGVQHRIPRPEVIDGRVDAHAPQRDEKRLRVLVLVHGGGLDEFYDAAPAAVVGERVIAGKGRVPRAVQQVLATEAASCGCPCFRRFSNYLPKIRPNAKGRSFSIWSRQACELGKHCVIHPDRTVRSLGCQNTLLVTRLFHFPYFRRSKARQKILTPMMLLQHL